MSADESPNLDQQVVSVLQALAQPTRLRIIELVSRAGAEGVAAGVIAKAVNAPASTLSFHLKELAQAGILEARPHGRFIYYATRADALKAVAQFVARWVPVEPTVGKPEPAARATPQPEGGGKPARRGGKVAKPKKPARDAGQLSIFGE